MKEYLLLRNNAQSGPYSLDELRGIGLRAYDLVWVENKSFSWKYPSEISELAPYAPALDETQSEPFKVEKTHMAIDVDDLARVLPGVKKENKKVNEETPIRHINHIVAFKPKIDHVEIRTIKSVSQPNIVNVQVRETEQDESKLLQEVNKYSPKEMFSEKILKEEVTPEPVDQLLLQTETGSDARNIYFNELPVTYARPVAGNSNKLELIVLAIGATSLIAVIYLLLTTGYQY